MAATDGWLISLQFICKFPTTQNCTLLGSSEEAKGTTLIWHKLVCIHISPVMFLHLVLWLLLAIMPFREWGSPLGRLFQNITTYGLPRVLPPYVISIYVSYKLVYNIQQEEYIKYSSSKTWKSSSLPATIVSHISFKGTFIIQCL